MVLIPARKRPCDGEVSPSGSAWKSEDAQRDRDVEIPFPTLAATSCFITRSRSAPRARDDVKRMMTTPQDASRRSPHSAALHRDASERKASWDVSALVRDGDRSAWDDCSVVSYLLVGFVHHPSPRRAPARRSSTELRRGNKILLPARLEASGTFHTGSTSRSRSAPRGRRRLGCIRRNCIPQTSGRRRTRSRLSWAGSAALLRDTSSRTQTASPSRRPC